MSVTAADKVRLYLEAVDLFDPSRGAAALVFFDWTQEEVAQKWLGLNKPPWQVRKSASC